MDWITANWALLIVPALAVVLGIGKWVSTKTKTKTDDEVFALLGNAFTAGTGREIPGFQEAVAAGVQLALKQIEKPEAAGDGKADTSDAK